MSGSGKCLRVSEQRSKDSGGQLFKREGDWGNSGVIFEQSPNASRVEATQTAERRTFQAERTVCTKPRKLE